MRKKIRIMDLYPFFAMSVACFYFWLIRLKVENGWIIFIGDRVQGTFIYIFIGLTLAMLITVFLDIKEKTRFSINFIGSSLGMSLFILLLLSYLLSSEATVFNKIFDLVTFLVLFGVLIGVLVYTHRKLDPFAYQSPIWAIVFRLTAIAILPTTIFLYVIFMFIVFFFRGMGV